ncbi:helix-turn-helix domain-containing protein [Lipingzhangella sp. LS1_29]|uniref:Helix-turn-helix domain-containing protein n=1 Tax=Lipingzhangella rawalii TaxID=2055835 RepID=A0ABU2HAM6_9ACTN|nr:helix-turn-helix domain-containing protein [Lipingzhangella rawalii]MDS1272377.1 helix-turn-helix domain-containing protein [Lipingzhangella rawalii]
MTRSEASAPRSAFDSDCPSRTVLNHVASRWGTLIITCLRGGPQRFYVLRDSIGGISEKMLSQNLRLLATDGLVERRVEPSSPPQVTYALTPLGEELAEHLQSLVDWVTLRTDEILATRARHGVGDS